jgi:DNA-directed RNA polymerase subunit E'/Rpb7
MEKKQVKYRKKQTVENAIYVKSLLTRSIAVPIKHIGNNLHGTIEQYISANYEGKCIAEGFVQPGSTKVITNSSGLIKGTNIIFEVVFECQICCPVEGMLIECKAKTITKAGIHAEVEGEDGVVPITVFIARDHNYNDIHFNNVKDNQDILVRVFGVRYELNDPYICVIAKLAHHKHGGNPTKLNVLDDNVELTVDNDDE